MRRWVRRVGAASGIWVALVGGLYLAEAAPRPGWLALVVATAAVGVWLVGDLAGGVEPVAWRPHEERGFATQGEEARTRAIDRELRAHLQSGRPLRTVLPVLVSAVDDAVAERHGVDAAGDAERVDELVGPELAGLLGAEPKEVRLRARDLGRIVAKVEAL